MKPVSNVKTPAQYVASLPADRAKTIATVRALVNKHIPRGYDECLVWGTIDWAIPLSSGSPSRGIMNRAMQELGPMNDAVPAIPLAGVVMAPLRASAEAARSGEFSPLWSGQNPTGCREMPAAQLTRSLANLVA